MKDSLFLFCCFNPRKCKMQEIPDASSFSHPWKKGGLLKLTGRGWLYSGSWKKRHCVLDGTKFYYYEHEKSRGSDKISGVLNLDYYDVCEELPETKDKKNPHVFVIGTSVRGFFDNRHQFAAESEAEMQDWIKSVHDVIVEARNIRSRAGRNRLNSGDKVSPITNARINASNQMNEEEEKQDGNEHTSGQLINATKDRVKGPPGRRLPQRKSMMPAATEKDETLTKQRSFSLSSRTEEDDDDDGSPSENRRISLSMEVMDHDNETDDVIDNQRSISNHDISSSEHKETKLPKKLPIFGKLGGQHAALTKELELKLKSGMTPGGRRFPLQEPTLQESKEHTSTEDNGVEHKLEGLHSKLNSMQSSLEELQHRVNGLKTNSDDSTSSAKSQLQEMISQAATILKEAEDTKSKCLQALADVQEAKDEQQRLLKDCQKTLLELKSKQMAVPEASEDIQTNCISESL